MPRLATYLLCAAIIATLAGGLGDSFQPARVILAGSAIVIFVRSQQAPVLTPIAKSAITMATIMFLGGLVSLLWTPEMLVGVGLMLAISVGALALYLVSQSDHSVAGVRKLMYGWLVAVGLSLPVAFYEIGTGNHFQFAFDKREIGGIGEFPFASIFFGNYNDYSTWLCLAFSINMALILNARRLWWKVLITAINVLTVVVIFVDTSRAALAFVFVVCLVYAVISNAFRLVSWLALAVGVPVMLARFGDQTLSLYDLAIFRFQVVGEADDSYLQRAGIIKAGIQGIIESFGFGVGVGGFGAYIQRFSVYLIPNPHNILLEIGANFGIITLAAFVLLIVRLFRIGLARKDLPADLRFALIIGTLGVPIIGVIPSQAIGYVYWWVWLATMVGIASAVPAPETMPSREYRPTV